MAAFSRKQYAGAAHPTTTTTSLTDSGTSVDIASTQGWPSNAGVPFYVVIEPGTASEEKCLATRSGSTLTLTRAQDDTSAFAHGSGSEIYPVFTANDADEANELVSKLTTKGDLLTTDGSTLNRLGVGADGTYLVASSSTTNGIQWANIPASTLESISDVVITAGHDGQLLQFDGTNWVNAVLPTLEPMGHEDRTQSTISFNNGSRQFTIAPASTSHTVWCAGKRHIKSVSETITIDNTSGIYYIYYDSNAVLRSKTSFFDLATETPVAYIYWNAVDSAASFFADERHGITMDWQTHEYLHRTRGAAIASGFGISGYILGGTGDLDSHAQVDIADGVFFDEDMEISITHSATPAANSFEQVLQGAAQIPMLYRTNSLFHKLAATDFPVAMGSSRAAYNLNTAGTWSLVDIDSNKYGVTYIVATNNINSPILGIVGQAQYSSIGAAEAAVYSDLELTGLPIYELRLLYKLVYQTANAYANTPKTRLISVIDLRTSGISVGGVPATPVSDHGSMTGLADDDHTQYLTDARHDALDHSTAMGSTVLDDIGNVSASAPANNDFLRWNGSAWVNSATQYDPVGSATAAYNDAVNYADALTYSLNDLTDVTIVVPSDQQFLKYVSASGQWVPANIPQINKLDDIGDVSVSSVVGGQYLMYNASSSVWVPNDVVSVVSSDIAPIGVEPGTMWFNTETFDTFIYYDSAWVQVNEPPSNVEVIGDLVDVIDVGSVTGNILEYNGTEWESVPHYIPARAFNSQSASAYVLVEADAHKIVEMTSSSANTVTVPPYSSQAFSIGTEIHIHQYGSGSTSIAAGSGVTIRTRIGTTLAGQYAVAKLVKRGTNEWVLHGDLV
jgi:hypothetical protein